MMKRADASGTPPRPSGGGENKLMVVVDVESDGPCPPLYSMVSFGAVVVEPGLGRTFYGKTAPLPGALFEYEALAVSGTTREEHLAYPEPKVTIAEFHRWLLSLGAGRLTLVSDNPAFDAPWLNYYFHAFSTSLPQNKQCNPFGHSARRIGDIWSGHTGKISDHTSWKDLRKTRHTHNPLDDARGNAEALLEIIAQMKKRTRP